MKKLSLLLLVVAMVVSANVIGQEKKKLDEVRTTPKFKLVPPGTVWLRDSLFIDQTEIRNIDWLEYMNWMERANPTNYKNVLPDTQCWVRFDTSLKAYTELYLRHPSYREYPVVGISYQQAIDYCEWRTNRVQEYLAIKEKRVSWGLSIDNPDTIKKMPNIPRYLKFRLPTEEEWEYAAQAGLTDKHTMGYESLVDKKGRQHLITKNYVEIINYSHKNNWGKYFTFPVYNNRNKKGVNGQIYLPVYKPNKFGICNMMGNVSELVSDSTFVKGLNFDTYIDANTIKTRFPNLSPSVKIGFRCVAEVY